MSTSSKQTALQALAAWLLLASMISMLYSLTVGLWLCILGTTLFIVGRIPIRLIWGYTVVAVVFVAPFVAPLPAVLDQLPTLRKLSLLVGFWGSLFAMAVTLQGYCISKPKNSSALHHNQASKKTAYDNRQRPEQ